MTHDPLCKVQNWAPLEQALDGSHYCQCEFIAKVREDERIQESARRMEKFGYWHDYRPELP